MIVHLWLLRKKTSFADFACDPGKRGFAELGISIGEGYLNNYLFNYKGLLIR